MRLAVACIVAMGMAGCGADEAARSVKDTIDPVARAAEKTAASGGARLDGEMVINVETLKIPMTIDGAISFDEKRMRMKLDVGQVKGLGPEDVEDLRKESEMPMEMVQTPDEIYVTTAKLREKGQMQGIEWAKIDLSQLDDEAGLDLRRANQFSEVNPEAMLRALRTTGDARKVGTDNIRGVMTDRYTATIDMRRYPELVPEDDRDEAKRTADLMIKEWGGPTQKLDVWISKAGLVLREQMPMTFKEGGDTFKATMHLDFLDIGQDQQVDAPDNDLVTDVTDEAADQVGG